MCPTEKANRQDYWVDSVTTKLIEERLLDNGALFGEVTEMAASTVNIRSSHSCNFCCSYTVATQLVKTYTMHISKVSIAVDSQLLVSRLFIYWNPL